MKVAASSYMQVVLARWVILVSSVDYEWPAPLPAAKRRRRAWMLVASRSKDVKTQLRCATGEEVGIVDRRDWTSMRRSVLWLLALHCGAVWGG